MNKKIMEEVIGKERMEGECRLLCMTEVNTIVDLEDRCKRRFVKLYEELQRSYEQEDDNEELQEKLNDLAEKITFPFVWEDEDYISIQKNKYVTYDIAKYRINTQAKVLNWLDHLSSKGWFNGEVCRDLIKLSKVEVNRNA
jgi:hypothetical protein